jgi:hypothetical protein
MHMTVLSALINYNNIIFKKSSLGQSGSYAQNPLFSAELELNAVLTIRSSFGILISMKPVGLVAASVAG